MMKNVEAESCTCGVYNVDYSLCVWGACAAPSIASVEEEMQLLYCGSIIFLFLQKTNAYLPQSHKHFTVQSVHVFFTCK